MFVESGSERRSDGTARREVGQARMEAERESKAAPTLIIVDSGLVSNSGHHQNTTRHFARAATHAGYSTFVCTPRAFLPPRSSFDEARWLACLSTSLYDGQWASEQKLQSMPIDILHALRSAGRRAEALERSSLFFFHTATLLQVAVAVRLLNQFLPTQGPRIKLCLRFEPARDPERLTRFSNTFRDALPQLVAEGRLELLAETEELAERHAEYLQVPCRLLPHVAVMSPASGRTDAMPTVGYLGEARTAKGFHLLPDLVEDMLQDDSQPACRFVIQASTRGVSPPGVRGAAERLLALQTTAADRLHLLEDALSEADYLSWMGQCDVLLLPYDSTDYRRRGSGVVVEGLIAGKPMLVPAGTWMARMTALGNGLTWHRHEDLASRLRQLLVGLEEYRAWAEAAAPIARRRHEPNVVFQTLLGDEG